MLEVILFGSIAVLAYVYAGYPLIVLGLGRLFPRPVRKGPGLRSVTIIVSAYNEELHIHDKLANLQKLDYPPGTWDVIVVSDASDDRTDAIVSAFHAKNVRLLRVEGRQGKTACQNIAAQAATGEILLFTDANTELNSKSVNERKVCTSTGLCEASQMARWKAWSRRACSRGSTSLGGSLWAASISS